MFFLPIELSDQNLQCRPLVTEFLLLLLTVTTALGLSNPLAIQEFALFPSDPFRNHGLTLLSSFFIHGGWFHLLGNLYFLFTFGPKVEDTLGRFKFCSLLLFSILVSSFYYFVFSIFSPSLRQLPELGSSGGLFGLMTYYALRFPKRKFAWAPLTMFTYGRAPVFRISARQVLGLYFVITTFGSLWQFMGYSGIAHLAHLGGILGGAFFWIGESAPVDG